MAKVDVTLVVPVLNEAGSLASLLSSIAGQTRRPAEVIFVDGGSTDDTMKMLRTWCESCDLPARVLEIEHSSPGQGRNTGIEAARTEWVALTDAGIELDSHWLQRLVRAVEADPDVDLVYGHYEPAVPTWFAACAALAYVGPPATTDRGPVRARSIASCLLRRSLWRDVGGFPDLRAAEDQLFMRRVEARGARVAMAPEAVVRWDLQPDLRRTFRRFRTYSEVNAHAGLQRDWQYGVARMYLAAAPFVALGAVRRRWLAVPAIGLLARAGRSVWERRQGRGPLWAVDPRRVATVAGILLTVDAATFAGWADAARARRRGG